MEHIYQNTYYNVQLVKEDTETPYHVCHNEHGVVEYAADNLPQALIVAEQFSALLTGDKFKHEVADLYGTGIRSVGDVH